MKCLSNTAGDIKCKINDIIFHRWRVELIIVYVCVCPFFVTRSMRYCVHGIFGWENTILRAMVWIKCLFVFLFGGGDGWTRRNMSSARHYQPNIYDLDKQRETVARTFIEYKNKVLFCGKRCDSPYTFFKLMMIIIQIINK